LAVDRALTEAAACADQTPTIAVEPQPTRPTRAQQDQEARRARRLARYETVIGLHQHGFSQCAISEQVGLDRKTIRRYLRADGFPEHARSTVRSTTLAPYEEYLRTRWTEGCQNAHQLWQEIQRQGFPGAAAIVRRHVAPWRTQPARRGRSAQRPVDIGGPPAPLPTRVLSPRQARWLLLRDWDELGPSERTYRSYLVDECQAIRETQQLADDFGRVIRTQNRPALDVRLVRAEASDVPEIRSFAAGLRRDQPAVVAAVTSPWSNGQTEGQVNRLKLLKRQMYGRASFPFLRHRLLLAA
jgi:transposase